MKVLRLVRIPLVILTPLDIFYLIALPWPALDSFAILWASYLMELIAPNNTTLLLSFRAKRVLYLNPADALRPNCFIKVLLDSCDS